MRQPYSTTGGNEPDWEITATVAGSNPSADTVTTIAPAWPRLPCTIAMQSPLNALRWIARSGS